MMITPYDPKTHCHWCFEVEAKVVVHWHYNKDDKYLVDQRFCIKCARSQYNKWKQIYWVAINRIGQTTKIKLKQ